MIIQPVVEGPGDANAVPVLLRRICYEICQCFGAKVAAPIKVSRSKVVQEQSFKKYLRIASLLPGCELILFFVDADDDCARELSEQMRAWAAEEGECARCEIIIIPKEFECWLIAAMESLRGIRGIKGDASSPAKPELVRNPKAILTEVMEGTAAYHETADQAALTSAVDLHILQQRCRSFDRLVRKVRSALGDDLTPLN